MSFAILDIVQKNKQPITLNRLVETLTKEAKVHLVREIFPSLESVPVTMTKKTKKKTKAKAKGKNGKAKNEIIRAWEPDAGDIVWAKMRGYCLWPGKVSSRSVNYIVNSG